MAASAHPWHWTWNVQKRGAAHGGAAIHLLFRAMIGYMAKQVDAATASGAACLNVFKTRHGGELFATHSALGINLLL
jgi:hypothetical protein